MSQSVKIAMGNGANPNAAFMKYLTQRAEAIRKIGENARSKEWHYGYYKGLEFVINAYVNLKFPGRETIEAYIDKERTKVRGDAGRSSDKKIKRRADGCLQCFEDVLEDVGRYFTWASMITG